MTLSLQNSYGLSIYCSDNKKIGILVNLLINNYSYEGNLVIFPGLKSEWGYRKIGKAGSIIGGLGTRVLQNLMPDLYDVVGIASDVQYEVIDELSERSERKARNISGTYFCIPSINIDVVEEDKIVLNIDSEECLSWYKNPPVSDADEFVFFDDSHYEGPYRLITISLGLQSVQGFMVYDPKNRGGRIIDINVDPVKGLVTSFDIKHKSGIKSIEVDYLQKELDYFSSKIEFKTSPLNDSKNQINVSNLQQIYLNSTETDIERRIILTLTRPKTIKELTDGLKNFDMEFISSTLSKLKEVGSIICLTPDKKNSQYYLSDSGLRIQKVLLNQERFEALK